MSMNLVCEEVDLWQTPTYITNMCFYTHDKKADNWRNIKYRYIEWVRHHSNGVWETEEELNDMLEIINAHIEELNSFSRLNFHVT